MLCLGRNWYPIGNYWLIQGNPPYPYNNRKYRIESFVLVYKIISISKNLDRRCHMVIVVGQVILLPFNMELHGFLSTIRMYSLLIVVSLLFHHQMTITICHYPVAIVVDNERKKMYSP